MKVVYSVATKIGGGGIGTTSYQAALGLYSAGLLGKTYCSSRILRGIPLSFLSSTNVSFFERVPFLPSSYQWLFKDIGHDLLTSLALRSINFGRGDFFHVWNGHGLYSLRVAKRKGARVVVERASSHPLTFERIMGEEYQKYSLRFKSLLPVNRIRLLRELDETDFITVPSDFAYQSMLENGVLPEKLVKIPFGVDTGKFRPVRDQSDSIFKALYVGQVGLRKGVIYLLDAWKKLRLKNARLTVVGQIDHEAKNLLKPYFGDPAIVFLDYTDSLSLYQSSDIFVFPSLEEGSALVTYEALACGLPVVTTLESGSVVEDDKDGFVVPSTSWETLAERIKYLYENPARRKEMSQHARTKAEAYTWHSYGNNLASFYKKVANRV